MVPGTNVSNSNPQKADGHIIDDHTRTLFTQWPTDSVVKVKDSSSAALKNVLKFRCRPFEDVAYALKADNQTIATGIELGTIISPIWDPANWGNGDGKVYTAATVYYNIYLGQIDHDNDPNTPDQDAWDVYTLNFVYNSDFGSLDLSSSSVATAQPAPSTTANAFDEQALLDGGSGNGTAYITFSGEIDYLDVITTYMDSPTYPAVTHEFCARKDGDSAHGLKDYVSTNIYEILVSDYSTVNTLNGFFTYILSDTAIPEGVVQRMLVKGRWQYTPDPNACGTCSFAGKTVTIEAKFKQATVSRTVTDDPPFEGLQQTVTIGTWSDHSTHTFTLTLPDSSTAQDLGTDFDFPTSAGKVVVLDDLKLVSIA
jgi:hypothetical protein